MKSSAKIIKSLLPVLAFIAACQPDALESQVLAPAVTSYAPEAYVKLKHPEWSKNASIYQLNTRQFSEEGTFAAAAEQLPRLKALGTDIIWLMPIHPIGEKTARGRLVVRIPSKTTSASIPNLALWTI
jgi:hypothetical protein